MTSTYLEGSEPCVVHQQDSSLHGFFGVAALAGAFQSEQSTTKDSRVPKIWDMKQLSTWATPVAGLGLAQNFYSEEDYYGAPIDNVRTYPVYAPGYEPRGYREWMRKQGVQKLIEPEKLKTEQDWIEAGRRVFEGLDFPVTRTDDPRVIKYLDNAQAVKKGQDSVSRDGIIPALRWVVDTDGKLKVSLADCASCHSRMMPDKSILLGAQGNLGFEAESVGVVVEGFGREMEERGMTLNETEYWAFGVPWLKDDIHESFKRMTPEKIGEVDGFPQTGTFARFNGSPYFITKIPDLIGVKDRLYLDHTGTHLNRSSEDIGRYAAMVSVADDGSFGTYRMMNDKQRRIRFRFSDEALYALGKFVYSLRPPVNPNKSTALSERGEAIFEREGCATCHTPPLYTNNMLMAVNGFTPAKTAATDRLHVMSGIRIDTDPNLALKTRKGTGFYKVPSLKGLWYRSRLEHSGSISTLEEWFDTRRLSKDYVPTGWKAPGQKARAIPGHQYGLDLSASDKRALIAFLRTL